MTPTPVKFNRGYAVTIARCVDILVAGWIWRQYDITISAECGLALRLETPPIWAIVIGRQFLNRIEANHCELAIAADYARAQAVELLLRPLDQQKPKS
jgi:hypothetical protein